MSGCTNRQLGRLLGQESLFVSQSIPALMRDYLREAGIEVPSTFDALSTIEEIIQLCYPYAKLELGELREKVLEARANAFDQKYANYTYEEDLRRLDDSWKSHLRDFITGGGAILDFGRQNVIVVGIGNGIEGVGLFETLRQLTIVNVAPSALAQARIVLPNAEAYLSRAEDLTGISSNSQDAYISLRTFQSAFFDVDRAIIEAGRVLRSSGRLIVSISNGYVSSREGIVRGQVTSGSEIDPTRPDQVCDQISCSLQSNKFHNIYRVAGFSEIFIHATK